MNNQHFSTLIKYIGISFITGAIAHGFFSGTRQILTAIFWIIVFVIGTLLEKDTKNTLKNILLSVGLAIAFGAATGGLQHFPDSPERSVWIFPLGVILSLPLFAYIHEIKLSKRYTFSIAIIGVLISLALFFIIEKTGVTGHTHEENTQTTIQTDSGSVLWEENSHHAH